MHTRRRQCLAGDRHQCAVFEHMFHGRMREASRLASEQMALLESVDDPTTTIGAATVPISIKYQTGQMADVLRWSQTVIDWAEGDSAKRSSTVPGSPLIALALVWRGIARWWLVVTGGDRI